MRTLIAVSLAWTLTAVGGAAPRTANAEETPVEATPVLSAEASLIATPSVMPTPTPAAAPVAPKKLTVRQLVAKIGRDSGLSKSEVAALLWLAKRESNFHPTSESRSECHGLFQLSKGMAHGHPWKDPTWNTKRAIKYMRGRYGGVLKAKAFWMSHHWY